MKLEEAIEILSEEVKHPYSAKKMSRPDALKLLIEAGKQVQFYRSIPDGKTHNLLPGETSD